MALSTVEKRLTMMLTHYWQEHRFASDTAEGMQRYWLPEVHGTTTQQFQTALDWLDDRELVEPVRAGDGRIRYRLREGVTNETFAGIVRALARGTS